MSDPRFIIVPSSALLDLAMATGFVFFTVFDWAYRRRIETRIAKVEVLFTVLHGLLTRVETDKAAPSPTPEQKAS